jgi:hypothetical protein
MIFRSALASSMILVLSGCAAVHNNTTIDVVKGVGDIYRAQAIDNLGKTLNRSGFSPNAVTLTTGSVQTQAGLTAGANVPIGDQHTIGQTIVVGTSATNTSSLIQPQKGLNFGASGQIQESWTLVPVVDDMVLARMRALYEFEASLRSPSEASEELILRYPVPVTSTQVAMPNVSSSCATEMKAHAAAPVTKMAEVECAISLGA